MPGQPMQPVSPFGSNVSTGLSIRQGRTGTEQITNLNNFTVTGTSTPSWFFTDLVVQHSFLVRGGSASPPTIAIGAGAGTGSPSVAFASSVNVSDVLMPQITLVTGTSPTANSTLATVTFGNSYHEISGDRVYGFFMPLDSISGGLGLYGVVVGGQPLTTGLTLEAANAPASNTTYNFGILVLSK